ncbi:hypothetical protein LTR91_022791 [Friedmanniomyces endolithicus]|uniref:DUF7924 domain-containing protein n=1 Tax=Friedmanniomyces endolithicus TaxID=329885 RepID=A0AAN6H7W5_9PEZI|nr:hypothetical protein LTR35_017453 [Friedmanniomyces endolithicus]KAK0269668.1 hypothetical protein LTS00_017198 [Friedmanniomyces endolithicus]KAK0302265.1 hypothetical protein LTR01_008862 [Friedmanniomyces endolithicus]KAK0932877.1 hypothetical protein LTR29_015547 [Friedmanniomyces endolithicus]KAK0954934.1 hypothetical protein LTS01_023649 [Friedmanniomyces endolithicus]
MAQRQSESKSAKAGSGIVSNTGGVGREPSMLKDQDTSFGFRCTEALTQFDRLQERSSVPEAQTRKRKRTPEAEDLPAQSTAVSRLKRRQTCLSRAAVDFTSGKEQSRGAGGGKGNPIDYWRKEGRWPKEYFEGQSNMSHLLARKKSSSSLRRKQSEGGSVASSGTTPSDQQPREVKSAPYKDHRYETLLETKGSFMGKHEAGVGDVSKSFHRKLLDTEQTLPDDSLFRDDLFDKACQNLQNKNEAKIVQDISRLIVPSAEHLALFGAKDLDILVESVNEGWNNSIPLIKTRPQPDYSAGFRRSAFTNEQLQKLQPFVGDLTDTSYFMATYYMYFPFLTCEVKCGAAALDVADRQNAHSMTLAVRGVVELFRLAKREKEVDREILAFSISHDHSTVRIYGHYPVIEGKNTTFYRHPIRKFDFTEQDGKEKWTAYKFTKNVYDVWMTIHFARICSVIEELPPDIAFEVSERSGLHVSEATGLSQGVEGLFTEPSDVDTQFPRTEGSEHGSLAGLQDVTPNTSLSPGTGCGTSKASKKRRTVT